MRADQEMRELPPRGAGLRQQLGDRRLQQVLGKQKSRLERHARQAAGATLRRGGLYFRVAVEEPARLALKQRRQQPEHVFGRHPLAALDHREVETDGALCGSSWMQRADKSSRVRPLRCGGRATWRRGNGSCGCAGHARVIEM
jgi:hypothetical protein